jgi:hypothetical protein
MTAARRWPELPLSLLLGYKEPPQGAVGPGLYYNPYFPGGAIAMPKMLVDGALTTTTALLPQCNGPRT